MASYNKNSFPDVITLKDFAESVGKSPKDFILETILVQEHNQPNAKDEFNRVAKKYRAVLGLKEGAVKVRGSSINSSWNGEEYMIRGAGLLEK